MSSKQNQDPYLNGYGDSYEGYGGHAPDFNRHFGEIPTPNEGKTIKLPFGNGAGVTLPRLGGSAPTIGSLKDINPDLVVFKTFYFFFYAAFGSLFPLIAVYFKQIGMNSSQCGALIGFRPFVEFFAAPFWGSIADKHRIWKQVLLFSIFCWIGFTLGLAFVKPPPFACLTYNTSHVLLVPPWSDEAMNIEPGKPYKEPKLAEESTETNDRSERRKRSAQSYDVIAQKWEIDADVRGQESVEIISDSHLRRVRRSARNNDVTNAKDKKEKDIELAEAGTLDLSGKRNKNLEENNLENDIRTIHDLLPYPKILIYGKSPLPLDHKRIANVDEKEVQGLVSPPFSAVVYKKNTIHKMFWLILFLLMLGE